MSLLTIGDHNASGWKRQPHLWGNLISNCALSAANFDLFDDEQRAHLPGTD